MILYGPLERWNRVFDVCVGMKERNYTVVSDELSDNGIIDSKSLSIFASGKKIYVIDDKCYEKLKDVKGDYNILNFDKFLGDNLAGCIVRPKKLSIEACTLCQLDCVDCYMREKDYDGVGKGFLSLDSLKEIVENYPYVEEIELSNNGEALLAPQLIEIFEYLHSKKIDITFYNGVNFNTVSDELIDAIVRCGIKGMTVSIDGGTQAIYEKYRKNGNFHKVINNIKKLNEVKKKYQCDNPVLYWQYILMNNNECDIEQAKTMSKELDMRIVFKTSWGGYSPSNPDRIRQLTGLQELVRADDYPWGNRCRQLLFQPHINWDGRLLGCCSSHSMSFPLNVLETGVEKAVNSEMYLECMRKVFLRYSMPGRQTPCGNCLIYNKYIL